MGGTYKWGGEREEERREEERGAGRKGDGRGVGSGRLERRQLAGRRQRGRAHTRAWPERAGTFRRKLATTCSKGYLYTWRTSTVTPIPARRPRLRERRATGATPGPRASSPRRPEGGGVVFFSPFSNFQNFIVHSEKQTGAPAPAPFRPRPVWAAGLGRCAGTRLRPEAPRAARPSPRPHLQAAVPLPGGSMSYPGALAFGTFACCVITSPQSQP